MTKAQYFTNQAKDLRNSLDDLKTKLKIRPLSEPVDVSNRRRRYSHTTLDEQIAEIYDKIEQRLPSTVKSLNLNYTSYKDDNLKHRDTLLEQFNNHPEIQKLIYRHHYLIETDHLIKKLDEYADIDRRVKLAEHKSPLLKALHIWKKVADVLDDLWNLIKGLIPLWIFNLISPVLTSVTGFFIHCMEAYDNTNNTANAYQIKHMPQRKMRIATGVLSSGLAIIGVVLSTLLSFNIGSTYAFFPFLQILIPGLLTTIYTLNLVKNSYVYAKNKHKAQRAATKLEDALAALNEISNNESYNAATCAFLTYPYLLTAEKALSRFEYFSKSYPLAERRMIFNTIEVLTSTMVLTGTALMMTPMWGLSLTICATSIPFSLVLGGVALGFTSKYADAFDEQYNFSYYFSLKNNIIRCKDWLKYSFISLPDHTPDSVVNSHYQIMKQMPPSAAVPTNTPTGDYTPHVLPTRKRSSTRKKPKLLFLEELQQAQNNKLLLGQDLDVGVNRVSM